MTNREYKSKISYLKSMGIDTKNLTAAEFALYFSAANKREKKEENEHEKIEIAPFMR